MIELLPKYIEAWDLSSAELIAETATSHVYKVDKDGTPYVLKLYTELGRIHEVMGPAFLKTCEGNGVVGVIDYNDEACLLEYIDGPEVLSLVDDNRDEEATLIIAQTLNKIHKTPIPENHQFDDFNKHILKSFNKTPLDDAPDIILSAMRFAEKLVNNQQEICILHGDMHHKNVMHHSTKGWLALDPHSLVGDRAYDCANTLHNPKEHPELSQNKDRLLKQVDIFSLEMNIDPQRIIDYAYVCSALSSCWTKQDDGEFGQEALDTSSILEKYISKGE